MANHVQIVFTRAGIATTPFAPFRVGCQVLAIVEDSAGATVRQLTEVRPTLTDTEIFTSADGLISVTGS